MALFDSATGGLGFGGCIGGQAAGYASPEQIRLAYMEALKRRNAPMPKIQHWTQGLAEMFSSGLAGLEMSNIEKAQQQQAQEGAEALVPRLGTGAMASIAPQSDVTASAESPGLPSPPMGMSAAPPS